MTMTALDVSNEIMNVKSRGQTPRAFQKLIGSPISKKFREPLTKEAFDYLIKSIFGRTRNRFHLWGSPIRFGPMKVHVYGVDMDLWQPIFMEITNKHLMAIIPRGTCGNTAHRLVTNIQRFIDPAAEVYIRDMKYNDMVDQSSGGGKFNPEGMALD